MKNTKFIIIVGLILMFFATACDSKLDERDGIFEASSTDYSKTENMVLPMLGSYERIYSRGWEDFPLLSLRGDDVNAGGLGDQQDYTETDLFNYNKDYWMYNSVWQNMHRDMIDINANINEILKFKEYATGDEIALADQYVAESKVLRAWLQFQLSRTWGKLFIIQTNSPADDIANGLKTKEEIMQYISDLMDEAIPDLADMRPNERTDIRGGVTKYTALALKAMANLELKDYQKVADATGQIINSNKFELFDDYYELFKKPGKLSDESLFEFQYSDYGTSAGNSFNYLNAFFGPQGWTPAISGAADGWGFYEPSMKYIKFMLTRGEVVRLQTSVMFTNRGIDELNNDPLFATLPAWVTNTTPDGDVINDYARAKFASGKNYLPSNQLTNGRTDYGSGKNMHVIRYAEVLLMYAEALKQGATGNAITADAAVNLVRQRAGLNNITGVTLQNVIDEKYAELAMEWGVRYFDMVRLNMYNELSYDGRTFTESKVFLPYPQAQVDALPLE
jgi:starch-binding outer membrane protein, SusD/RagB family